MTGPRIMVGADDKRPKALDPAPEVAWGLLGGIGLVFAVVALADLVLAWYPPAFGNAEWEFGTVTSVLGSLPLLTMGLALLYGGAVGRGKGIRLRIVVVALAALALLILAMLGLYVRHISTALAAVQDPVMRSGLKESIAKTLLQGLLYPAGFIILAVRGWRHASG